MFALFDLIFVTIKIGILSAIYAFLTVRVLIFLSKKIEKTWLSRLMRRDVLVSVAVGILYAIGLFNYAFSYWGNAGFGDFARIPLGNGAFVCNLDGIETSYIEPNVADVTKFRIKDKTICGAYAGYRASECKDCFIVFNAETKKTLEFKSFEDYTNFAKKNKLPEPHEFKDFFGNYDEHWGGWRRFLLP